jgi:hypothetical protein
LKHRLVWNRCDFGSRELVDLETGCVVFGPVDFDTGGHLEFEFSPARGYSPPRTRTSQLSLVPSSLPSALNFSPGFIPRILHKDGRKHKKEGRKVRVPTAKYDQPSLTALLDTSSQTSSRSRLELPRQRPSTSTESCLLLAQPSSQALSKKTASRRAARVKFT